MAQELHNWLQHRSYETQPLGEHRARQGTAAQQVLQHQIREHFGRQSSCFETHGARCEPGEAAQDRPYQVSNGAAGGVHMSVPRSSHSTVPENSPEYQQAAIPPRAIGKAKGNRSRRATWAATNADTPAAAKPSCTKLLAAARRPHHST